MSEQVNCIYHKDRPAVGRCVFCKRPVCDECHEGAYCILCIKEPPKLQSITLLCAVFFGLFGVHRYYMGFKVTGVIYTLTLGLFGVGVLIDVIRILLWSTIKDPTDDSVPSFIVDVTVGSFAGAIGDTIQEEMSKNTRDFLGFLFGPLWRRRFWRDKHNRPLLPLGKRSLT